MKEVVFDRFFNSIRDQANNTTLLSDRETVVAAGVYNTAVEIVNRNTQPSHQNAEDGPGEDEPDSDIASIASFDSKIETAMMRLEHVLHVFEKSETAKETFLNSFEEWSKGCKTGIRQMRELAEEMQADSEECHVVRAVANTFSALSGVLLSLSIIPSPATPLLAAVGGLGTLLAKGVEIGTTSGEIDRLKDSLKKANTLIQEENRKFSSMANWFSIPEELENAIEALVDINILNEIAKEYEEFNSSVEQEDMTDDEFQNQFKQLLDHCMGRMAKDKKLLKEYGKELAPAVMTFVFVVSLMKNHNRIILECSSKTQYLAWSQMDKIRLCLGGAALVGALALKGVAKMISKLFLKAIVWFGVFVDIVMVVLSYRAGRNKITTEQVEQLNDIANKFEKLLFYIQSVYNETKKYKSPIQWKSVVVEDALPADLKVALKNHLPKEIWRLVKFRRLRTEGNNWYVELPEEHSSFLLKVSECVINGKNCKVLK